MGFQRGSLFGKKHKSDEEFIVWAFPFKSPLEMHYKFRSDSDSLYLSYFNYYKNSRIDLLIDLKSGAVVRQSP